MATKNTRNTITNRSKKWTTHLAGESIFKGDNPVGFRFGVYCVSCGHSVWGIWDEGRSTEGNSKRSIDVGSPIDTTTGPSFASIRHFRLLSPAKVRTLADDPGFRLSWDFSSFCRHTRIFFSHIMESTLFPAPLSAFQASSAGRKFSERSGLSCQLPFNNK